MLNGVIVNKGIRLVVNEYSRKPILVKDMYMEKLEDGRYKLVLKVDFNTKDGRIGQFYLMHYLLRHTPENMLKEDPEGYWLKFEKGDEM